jgi:hypothetical protein
MQAIPITLRKRPVKTPVSCFVCSTVYAICTPPRYLGSQLRGNATQLRRECSHFPVSAVTVKAAGIRSHALHLLRCLLRRNMSLGRIFREYY